MNQPAHRNNVLGFARDPSRGRRRVSGSTEGRAVGPRSVGQCDPGGYAVTPYRSEHQASPADSSITPRRSDGTYDNGFESYEPETAVIVANVVFVLVTVAGLLVGVRWFIHTFIGGQ